MVYFSSNTCISTDKAAFYIIVHTIYLGEVFNNWHRTPTEVV